MKIRYVHRANLFHTPIRRILHGCNAQGVMGSGVAGEIRKHHPEVYDTYRKAYEDNGNKLDLGDVIWATYNDGSHVVANMITQQFYGRDKDRVYVDYAAIEIGFVLLDGYFAGRASVERPDSPEELAMPLIGAGLANGSWTIISEIIERRSRSFRPVVYTLDGIIPE